MSKDPKEYQELFSHLDSPLPPADLAQRTLLAIARRERRILAVKLVGLGATFVASIIFVAVEFTAVGTELIRAGSFQFMSMFFSDFTVAAGNLPDLALSIIESLPVLSMGFAVGGLAVAAWSFAGFLDDANALRL